MSSYDSQQLARMLSDARARTLRLVNDLTDEQLIGPQLPIVNPLLWEIGHVAWFQERWVLRHQAGDDPIWREADSLYDSSNVPHDTRWSLALPSRAETLSYMQAVLDRILERTCNHSLHGPDIYFRCLATFHEDMHCEAFAYTRQTLGYPSPAGQAVWPTSAAIVESSGTPLPGDVLVPGGKYMLGSERGAEFVFDNEKWAHAVEIHQFRIARAPVTNGEFVRFVNDGGYELRECWTESGWRWRLGCQATCPVYWQRKPDGTWWTRRYDATVPLDVLLPVAHVNWYEVDAYCRWAGRRLPSEAEWEVASAGEPTWDGQLASSRRRYPWGNDPPAPDQANLDLVRDGPIPVHLLPGGDSAFGCRQMIGNVWEWTASDFEPYPGFTADAYKDYSEPWFGGTHKVLRGGAFATRSRMITNYYRNFYTPDRRDVLAGFRTCSLQP